MNISQKTPLFLSLLVMFYSFNGCVRKPEACIDVSTTTIDEGQSLTFKDCSSHSKSNEWVIEGQSVTDQSTLTHKFDKSGSIKVELNAYSKKKKKSDNTSVTIHVNPTTGTVIMYKTGVPQYGDIEVTFQGRVDTITTDYALGVWECDKPGCAIFDNVPAGNYYYDARELVPGGMSWDSLGAVSMAGLCAYHEIY